MIFMGWGGGGYFYILLVVTTSNTGSPSSCAVPLMYPVSIRLFVMTYLGFGANEAMNRHHRHLLLGEGLGSTVWESEKPLGT